MEENRDEILSKEEESEILEIFPQLDKIPDTMAAKFRWMIHWFLKNKRKCSTLEYVIGFNRVGKVFDDQDKVVCFFKDCEDAKKEATVYLLDHPISSRRSKSSDLIGFGGATPTVFIKTKDSSGCLVSFVENDGVVGDYTPFVFNTLPQEIHKLCIFHMRFGSADCHGRNTISKIDAEGIHRLTPIDHEECFTANYHLRRVWWEENKGASEPFTQEMVKYVEELDVDGDINYLKSCGWEDVPSEITVPFKIFTFFLKKAVQCHLTASETLVVAQNKHKTHAFNLPNMVLQGNPEGDEEVFVKKACEKIETKLKEYARKLHKNLKP